MKRSRFVGLASSAVLAGCGGGGIITTPLATDTASLGSGATIDLDRLADGPQALPLAAQQGVGTLRLQQSVTAPPDAFRILFDNLPPVLQQGEAGSCMAWGSSEMLSYMAALDADTNKLKPGVTFGTASTYQASPLFLYASYESTDVSPISCMAGGQAPDYMWRLSVLGAPSFAAMPYPQVGGGPDGLAALVCGSDYNSPSLLTRYANPQNASPPASAADMQTRTAGVSQLIPHFNYQNAKGSRSKGCTPEAITEIQQYIATGWPVAFLMEHYPDYHNATLDANGVYTGANASGSTTGHCQLIIGYNNALNAFLVQNSWGRNWQTQTGTSPGTVYAGWPYKGDDMKGRIWLSYDYFKAHASAAWFATPRRPSQATGAIAMTAAVTGTSPLTPPAGYINSLSMGSAGDTSGTTYYLKADLFFASGIIAGTFSATGPGGTTSKAYAANTITLTNGVKVVGSGIQQGTIWASSTSPFTSGSYSLTFNGYLPDGIPLKYTVTATLA